MADEATSAFFFFFGSQLLLCGDFNSLPDSGVVEFLNASRIAANHPDFKELGYKTCLQKVRHD